MTTHLSRIQSIAKLAIGTAGEELAFPYPEVLDAIRQCSDNEIAVLGVELLVANKGEYYATGSSDYDLKLGSEWQQVSCEKWRDYVKVNNQRAEDFVRENAKGDDHVYILTTSSWKEFQELVAKNDI